MKTYSGKVKASEIPRRKRTGISRFEGTQQWQLMKADIDSGLAPGMGVYALLTDDWKTRYRIKNRRTVARFIKKYLAAKGLPYYVSNYHRDEGDIIRVENRDKRATRKSA